MIKFGFNFKLHYIGKYILRFIPFVTIHYNLKIKPQFQHECSYVKENVYIIYFYRIIKYILLIRFK
jgi:hypothetical protein